MAKRSNSATALDAAGQDPSPVPVCIETGRETVPAYAIDPGEVSRLAYSYWEARGYQSGSPEEDWFRAENELKTGRA